MVVLVMAVAEPFSDLSEDEGSYYWYYWLQ